LDAPLRVAMLPRGASVYRCAEIAAFVPGAAVFGASSRP